MKQFDNMQSVIICVQNLEARSHLQEAALMMGMQSTLLTFEQLISKNNLFADWIITEGGVEDIIRLSSHLTRSGINPRLTIIRLIDQLWSSYVYHDLPIYASMVRPANPQDAADVLTRVHSASLWLRHRLKSDWEANKPILASQQIELGHTPAMLHALDTASRVAALPVDILIQGETGTGKDTFSRWIHQSSGRKGNFVHINCAALPEQLIESELFGVEAGAFTGALKSRIGKLEYAREGTLYLDEIDSMPITSQAKLLRALQDRGAERLGGHRFIHCDFRVIASTKVDLTEMVEKGLFRQDLLFRLNVVHLFLPPLRQRSEDIPLLFQHFCQQAAVKFKLDLPKVESNTVSSLLKRRWSGNVRELKAYAERFVLGVERDLTTQEHSDETSLKEALQNFERQLIENALRQHAFSVKAAAGMLKTTQHALYYRMKQLGISTRDEAIL